MRAFLLGLSLSLALGLVLQALMMLVDPGAVWHRQWPDKPQLCTPGLRIDAGEVVRAALWSARPAEALLGSSRVQAQFARRDTEAQLQAGVVNLGTPGADVAYLEWLLAAAPRDGSLRRIWLGLDYGMFTVAGRDVPRAGPADSAWATALGAPSLRAALRALHDADDCATPARDLRGFEDPRLRERTLATFGWRHGFALSRQQLASQFGVAATRDAGRARRLAELQWMALERLMADARRRDITVVIFVSPSHREYAALIEAAGLGADHRAWRRRLRGVTTDAGVPLFDWSEALHAERPDAACERDPGQCSFYNVNHATPRVGAQLLARMRTALDGSPSDSAPRATD